MKFKSVINRVPVDSMDCPAVTCFKVEISTVTSKIRPVIFTDMAEAMLFVKQSAQKTFGGKEVILAEMWKYESGYWTASAFHYVMYDHGEFNTAEFAWD